MKKLFVLLVLTMCGLMTAFGQLKVTNNFGQDLNITVGGQKNLVNYKGIKTFKISGRTVWLECQSLDGKIKFSISKEVSRRGLVSVEPGDFSPQAPNKSAETVTTNVLPSQSTGGTGSLAAILKGTNKTNVAVTTSPTPVPNNAVNIVLSTAVSAGERIAFVYKGSDRFKIFSEIGRGLEFKGGDSLNAEDNAKNRYVLNVPRNQDLIIGLGIKEGENQAIWRYAEIRKRVNSWDTACYIYQKDIKKMSTSENKSLRIRLIAQEYKIFFEPDSGEPISIGYRETSRSIDVPVGQFYIRVSYTDPRGMFHRTVFVPKHVTKKDRYLDITKNDLDNSVQLNW
ncbi:MAG: hypothetical protein WCK59_04685 [Candidatus Falkowbacteria bacterium]